jgi:hypothetical protein
MRVVAVEAGLALVRTRLVVSSFLDLPESLGPAQQHTVADQTGLAVTLDDGIGDLGATLDMQH